MDMMCLVKLLLQLGIDDDTVNFLFEKSGCCDAIENLQYDKNQQVYILAKNIITAYNDSGDSEDHNGSVPRPGAFIIWLLWPK